MYAARREVLPADPFIPIEPVPDSKRVHVTKGDILVVRRFVTLTLSFCLVLGVGILQVSPSFGQGEAKKDDANSPTRYRQEGCGQTYAPKTDAAKPAQPATKEAPKAAETAKEAPKATEAPLPPIPPEVQAKIEAARKAVAEAIVAAQDAGLVETSIDPPPDPRYPDHRPRDRRTHAQGTTEAVRRQPRGLRRLVHRLRHAGGNRLRP